MVKESPQEAGGRPTPSGPQPRSRGRCACVQGWVTARSLGPSRGWELRADFRRGVLSPSHQVRLKETPIFTQQSAHWSLSRVLHPRTLQESERTPRRREPGRQVGVRSRAACACLSVGRSLGVASLSRGRRRPLPRPCPGPAGASVPSRPGARPDSSRPADGAGGPPGPQKAWGQSTRRGCLHRALDCTGSERPRFICSASPTGPGHWERNENFHRPVKGQTGASKSRGKPRTARCPGEGVPDALQRGVSQR